MADITYTVTATLKDSSEIVVTSTYVDNTNAGDNANNYAWETLLNGFEVRVGTTTTIYCGNDIKKIAAVKN